MNDCAQRTYPASYINYRKFSADATIQFENVKNQ